MWCLVSRLLNSKPVEVYSLLDQQGSLTRHLAPFVDDLDTYSSGWCRLLEVIEEKYTVRNRNVFRVLLQLQVNWLFKLKCLFTSRTYRFDNPFLPGATILPGLAEQLDVLRKDKGLGEKVELSLPKANLHLRQVPPKPVLPANLKCSWEMVQLR